MADFSLKNLSENPNFDFVNNLIKNCNEDTDGNFSFSESPYELADLSCVYLSET